MKPGEADQTTILEHLSATTNWMAGDILHNVTVCIYLHSTEFLSVDALSSYNLEEWRNQELM